MIDYYAYCCHYTPDQYNPYTCCGRATSLLQIDCYTCLEENRLWFIVRKPDELRSESFHTIAMQSVRGVLMGGKQTFLIVHILHGLYRRLPHGSSPSAACSLFYFLSHGWMGSLLPIFLMLGFRFTTLKVLVQFACYLVRSFSNGNTPNQIENNDTRFFTESRGKWDEKKKRGGCRGGGRGT